MTEITNAWKLTLICYDANGELDDPEELFDTLEGRGAYRSDLRCALVSPCEPVRQESLANSGLLDGRK